MLCGLPLHVLSELVFSFLDSFCPIHAVSRNREPPTAPAYLGHIPRELGWAWNPIRF